MLRERIAVTGVGVVCAAGPDRHGFFARLVSGATALRLNQRTDVGPPGSHVVGEVDDEALTSRVTSAETARYGRDVVLALTAAREALQQAGLAEDDPERSRAGLVLGKCQGTTPAAAQPAGWVHATADSLAVALGVTGSRQTVSTACAAGSNAVGIALDRILAGDAEVMLAGGVDTLQLGTLAGFGILQAVDPEPCAPYSRSGGLNLGEGAAFLVLESVRHASARGASALAEVLGYGLSADAYHASAPDPTGTGAALAVSRALADAGIEAADVTYVNGHGTGTRANDTAERRVMRAVFGSRAGQVPLISTKSFTGHTLGAAGAVEAVASVQSIVEGVIPPTVNFAGTAPADLDFVPGTPRRTPVDVVVSNNYAFGGNNASVVFAAAGDGLARARSRDLPCRDVVITGVGLVGRCGIGADEWIKTLSGTGLDLPDDEADSAVLGRLQSERFAAAATWRQMNMFTRLCTAATRLAVQDAALPLTREARRDTGLYLGTMAGPGVVMGAAMDPSAGRASRTAHLFTQATLNAPAGAVCQAFGFRGPTTTIVSGATSGTLALEGARDAIRFGRADTIIVVAADEASSTPPGIGAGDLGVSSRGTAAVALVLEGRDTAAHRGARQHGRLLGIAHTADTHHAWIADLTGDAYARSLRVALERAGITPEAVELICASGDGAGAAASADVTRLGVAEAAALSRVFAGKTQVLAATAVTGSCGAASGLINVIYPVLAAAGPGISGPVRAVDALAGHWQWVQVPRARGFLAASASFGGTYGAVMIGRDD